MGMLWQSDNCLLSIYTIICMEYWLRISESQIYYCYKYYNHYVIIKHQLHTFVLWYNIGWKKENNPQKYTLIKLSDIEVLEENKDIILDKTITTLVMFFIIINEDENSTIILEQEIQVLHQYEVLYNI